MGHNHERQYPVYRELKLSHTMHQLTRFEVHISYDLTLLTYLLHGAESFLRS